MKKINVKDLDPIESFKTEIDKNLENIHKIDRVLGLDPKMGEMIQEYTKERNEYWHNKFAKMSNDEFSTYLMSSILTGLDKLCAERRNPND